MNNLHSAAKVSLSGRIRGDESVSQGSKHHMSRYSGLGCLIGRQMVFKSLIVDLLLLAVYGTIMRTDSSYLNLAAKLYFVAKSEGLSPLAY